MSPAPDRLLADSAWLRNLARKLVGDEFAADLQQDVALAALSNPQPATAGRSWLAAVAHNLAITLRRRRVAEQRRVGALPPREPVPSPAELVATAELQQRAVAAVLALPPVYRDTVLLRFLHGLPLQATAAAMGVPEETVRTRQKRALALLRERLAPRRPDRRGLAALLAPIAAWGAVVKVKPVVVGSAALLAALLVTVPFLSSGATAPQPQAGGSIDAVHADAAEARRPTEPGATGAGERTEVAAAAPAAAPTDARLTVEVLQSDGAPAARCALVCARWDAGDRRVRYGATDAAGEAVFTLAPGRYLIDTPQRESERVDIVAGEDQHRTITLQPGFAVRGIVFDSGGVPVAGAAIWIAHVGVAPNWTFAVGTADHGGRFAIPACKEGMVVGASDPRLGIADAVLLTRQRHAGATPEEVALHLDARVTEVQGRVVDVEGRPVAAAWVQLGAPFARMRPDQEGRLWMPPPATICSTDADGRFPVPLARTDEAQLTVTHPGFAPHREELAMTPHLRCEVTIVLQRCGVLTGTVRDEDGGPIAGAEVSGPMLPGLGYEATTAADGTFTLADLAPGEHEFTVRAAGWAQQVKKIAFASGAQRRWDVVLARGLRIRGRLVDPAGEPLAQWWIGRQGANRSVKTDAEGRFVVTDCASDGNLLIVRDQFVMGPAVLRLPDLAASEDERTFVVPDAARPSARLRGQCVDPDGAALGEVTFDCTQGDRPALLQNAMMRAAGDGTFDLGPWPPGQYVFTPVHLRFVFAPLPVDLQANEVHEFGVLRGVLPASLTVRLGGDTAAIARAQVALVAAGRGARASGTAAERAFRRVFPGRYRLQVTLDGGECHAEDIDLAAGAELTREVALR